MNVPKAYPTADMEREFGRKRRKPPGMFPEIEGSVIHVHGDMIVNPAPEHNDEAVSPWPRFR